MDKLYLLDLGSRPIFEQLRLEEALLRTSALNICLVNRGSPRTIVMGISGNPERLLHTSQVQSDRIPVIRRFSGGGTVIVDEDTLFISFLMTKEAVPVAPFPEPILRWSSELYEQSWNLPGFRLVENDYVIGEHKCGGNAQYIRQGRWLHHTSFLWDYSPTNMEYLRLPEKRPRYRADRPHSEFLCRLRDHAESKEVLVKRLYTELSKRFELSEMEEPREFVPHRRALELVEL